MERFVLIGGTALALQINHRHSEDLDFVFPGSRLPRARLNALKLVGTESGFAFTPDDDETAVHEFANSTLDLHDYQQDYLVNGVRVSFFAPDQPMLHVLENRPSPKARVASLEEIFKTKCLVSAIRSKTRDWLDLYLLLREHEFSIQDFAAAFKQAGIEAQIDIAFSRLCSGTPQANDEGYAHLLSAPPSIEEMRDYFTAQRNFLEVQRAAEAARRKNGRDKNRL